jgi:hypothetical protein
MLPSQREHKRQFMYRKSQFPSRTIRHKKGLLMHAETLKENESSQKTHAGVPDFQTRRRET